MQVIFTLRLKPDIALKLAMLAESSQRTRASVIRWLIAQAAAEELAAQLGIQASGISTKTRDATAMHDRSDDDE